MQTVEAQLVSVREEITRTAIVVQALCAAGRDEDWPGGVPSFISADSTAQISRLHHLLAYEQKLMVSLGEAGNA